MSSTFGNTVRLKQHKIHISTISMFQTTSNNRKKNRTGKQQCGELTLHILDYPLSLVDGRIVMFERLSEKCKNKYNTRDYQCFQRLSSHFHVKHTNLCNSLSCIFQLKRYVTPAVCSPCEQTVVEFCCMK